MARQDDEKPDILFPFDAEQASAPAIVCPNPKCRNDGMDGSITGRSGQWGIKRICKKCGQEWSGGIGVQRADFSEPMHALGSTQQVTTSPERSTQGPLSVTLPRTSQVVIDEQ